jgi:tetratricopeptide (TPR) repeat protein
MLKNLLVNLFSASKRSPKQRGEVVAWSGLESVIPAFNKKDYVLVIEQCRVELQQDAHNVQANHFCGRALMELDRHAEAESYLRAAVAADADLAEAHADLAEVLRKAGHLQSAEESCRRAVAISPMDPRYRMRLVDILEDLSRQQEALEELSLAQECAPDRFDVLERLVLKLDQLGQYALALRIAERAMVEIGETFETQFFLGYARFSTGDHPGAVEACQRAIKLRKNVPGIYVTLGSALLALGRADEAAAAYKRSLKVLPTYPDASFHLGMLNLMRGRYRDGWAGFEYRFKIPRGTRRPCEPRWNGTSLRDRTLHVLREQGLGDDIMYSSCYPQLINDAKHCVIECEPRLEKLFVRSFPQATFVPIVDNATKTDVLNREDVDVRIFSASVPGYLRNSIRDFPAHQGFLSADPQRVAYWRAKLDGLGGGLKVGISWKGGTVYTHRNRRTLSLEKLLPLLSTPNVHWINLQYGERKQELSALKGQHSIEVADWTEAIDGDYDETAALVGALDLVVSVCTSVIHLGGALGRPVWVMVPFAPEWRYGLQGEAMPWYPSVRLHRQTDPGDWDAVMNRIRDDLSALLKAH